VVRLAQLPRSDELKTPTLIRQPAPTLPTSTPASLEPVTLTVMARNLSFSPNSPTIPAHVTVTLVMRNEDSGVLRAVGLAIAPSGP